MPKPEPNAHALNAKESRPILEFLKDHFGFTGSFEFAFIIASKERLFAATKEIFSLPVEQLKVSSYGVYFGEWREGTLRLSIEGSQIVGPHCSKNIVEITEDQRADWMSGEDIDRTEDMDAKGIVLIKCGKDFLGCSKTGETKLSNYVPKNRRVVISS
ncbi:MAG TPA: hypothetical protein VJH22_04740 [Candidatus Nanoarchaeia archaeon]|nr:hypothetical protein [Candidatus Nanoarchaeia archaeon]